jgi:lysophospholipase L1-like esterase
MPLKRLALTTIVLFPVVLGGLIAYFWLESVLPGWVYWQAGLVLLVAGEIAYGAALLLVMAGLPAFAFLMWKRWIERASLRRVARGLSLCLSLLLGLGVAEGVSGYWQYRRHRSSALVAGGHATRQNAGAGTLPSSTSNDVELPSEFPDEGNDHDIDITILGESSAEGVPYNFWLSIGRILEWQIEGLLHRPVRQRTLAFSGHTLELQETLLGHVRRRPEVLVIYCGHNEFSARMRAGRDIHFYIDDDAPSAWDLFVERVESVSPLCGLIRETAEKCRIAIPPPPAGYRDLVDRPVYTMSEYKALLADFRRRLERIVSYAERTGALVVLVVPAANDAGFEPNRSFLPATTTRAARAAFRRDFLRARRLEASDPAAAIAAFRALLAAQPGFAESQFRLARLLERTGRWEEAYSHFVAARDQDGFPMRCLTALQDVYRETAARHGSILIDSQAYFRAIGPHGLLDDHLFHDGIHPSLRGQIALAQAILRGLKERGALGWPRALSAPVIDPAACARHFGLGAAAWRSISLWGMGFYELTRGMRYDSAERLFKRQVFADAADRIKAGAAPEAVGLPNIGVPEAVPMLPE